MKALCPKRGEILDKSEYYSIDEFWPQPPDEACTLESTAETRSIPKKKKKNGRIRKKMSESLAGVTAAALTVVMVASSIPVLKDAFDDFPELPDLGKGEICMLCGEENCPYFSEGLSGLRLTMDAEPEYALFDLYGMHGFYDGYLTYANTLTGILTDDDQRLVLMVDSSVADPYGQFWRSYDIHIHPDWHEGTNTIVVGMAAGLKDEKTDDYIGSFLVLLAYGMNGTMPDPDINYLRQEELSHMIPIEADMQLRKIAVDSVDNAAVFVYSDLGADFLNSVDSYFEVAIIPTLDQEYELGNTMLLRENESLYRAYYDNTQSGSHRYIGFHSDKGETEHFFEADFSAAIYTLTQFGYNDVHVTFVADNWIDIFAKYDALNQEAAMSGHGMYFPMDSVGEITVNDIQYQCYIAYTGGPVDDVNNGHWITYFYVPKQEDSVAFSVSESIQYEELKAFLEAPVKLETLTARGSFLENITLR